MHVASSSESMEFAANKHRFSNRTNNYKPPSSCGYNGSTFSGNKSIIGDKRAGLHNYCTHCKIPGHSLEMCFKIHRYPQDYKPSRKRFDAAVQGHDIYYCC